MSTVLITGASSGLGAALARGYSRPGIHLVLWGRDRMRLQAVASSCEVFGATVEVDAFDLKDCNLTVARLQLLDSRKPIDLAIFNAGIGGLTKDQPVEAPERIFEIATVNFTATAVGAATIGSLMLARRSGQIVIVGSVSEAFPLPMAPAYAGSKAGIAMFAQALDLRLRGSGVPVTLISPGFIDTPMSRTVTTAKPFILGVDEAAAAIVGAIAKKTRHFVFPWQMALLSRLSRYLPRSVTRFVLERC